MIAAGANVKALASYMGHASVTITLDRYGHLMPGNEDEAAEQLGTFAPPPGSGEGDYLASLTKQSATRQRGAG
jgi:hypothetical protein